MIAFASQPEFRFRGDRNYLHGTTVFDWLVKHDTRPTNIDFQFHKMTGFQCSVTFGAPSDSPKLVAVYQSDGITAHLAETTIPIVNRYSCNEERICERLRLQDDAACFDFPLIEDATFSEVLIGAYKLLLTNTFSDIPGKLVFARCRFNRLVDSGRCQVVHRRKVGNFFEAQILQNNESIGNLYFGAK